MASNMNLGNHRGKENGSYGDVNYKLGSTYCQSIPKLAVFSLSMTLYWVSKRLNHSYDSKNDLRYITEYPGGKENGFCVILIAN